MSNAIEVHDISKRFRLYHEKYSSLKERVLHAGHTPYDDFWALRDINAEFPTGKTIGILGRNGSGKSTLLKCIAGILQPTTGQVIVRGQIAAMLELGAGFQPELSGRDNIYLNGSLLGLSRRDIAKRFDAIVEFAELEQFIDNQVKYYSSGMYVRLGFAVAVNVEPDVLLVDEVLAVGDERFQAKCLERVYEFQRDGRTIVVVTHAPDLLRQICDEILVLDRGEIVTMSAPGEAIRLFRETLIEAGDALGAPPEEPAITIDTHEPVVRRTVKLGEVTIEHPGMAERPYIVSGEPLTAHLPFEVFESVAGAQFTISIFSDRGDLLFSSPSDNTDPASAISIGNGHATFSFTSITLLDGRFTINFDVRDHGGVVLDSLEAAAHFEVMNPGRVTGVVGLPLHVAVTAPGVGSDIAS